MAVKAGLAAVMLALLCAPNAYAGEECRPQRYAVLDMTPVSGGGYAVPVEIAGNTYRMIFKTTPYSYIFDRYAAAAQLERKPVGNRFNFYVNGQAITDFVRLPELTVGGNRGHDLAMMVIHTPSSRYEPDIIGTMGTDLLQTFDVEVDFKGRKLSLFKPNPCDGAGVYWNVTYAVLPMEKDRAGQMSFTMSLDGHRLSVMFDGISVRSSMAYNLAIREFGVPPPGDRAADVGSVRDADRGTTRQNAVAQRNGSRRFAALDAGGLTIYNPEVYFHGDPDAPLCNGRTRSRMAMFGTFSSTCYSGPELTLGLKEMEQLHLLFAFKAKKLYITAADAHP